MKQTKAQFPVHQIITDRIIELLKKGTVPWQQPWHGGDQLPRNLVSKKPYRGVNVFLLHSMSYQSPFWLTYKQAEELGGNVKHGEHATPVVFWKRLEVTEDDGTKKQIPMLRYYSVFNALQCEGIEKHLPQLPTATTKHDPIPEAQAVVDAMPKRPDIRHGQGKAYYSPALDYVGMPAKETFNSPEGYYDTLFHELTHSTGHESRLARKGVSGTEGTWGSFGSNLYAKEELVAEMGAAFLCGHVGIVDRTIDNSAAYIASWLQRLSDDPKLVVNAAAQAQKASDFILGIEHTTETPTA